MNYNDRCIALNNSFKIGVDTHLEESGIDIKFYRFNSAWCDDEKETSQQTIAINENLSFDYPIFSPEGSNRHEKAILLLHGLNERNWSKYLPWAEYLALQTGRPVILFPIAFHINRSPQTWSNPRSLTGMLNFRREKCIDDRSLSFANVALSERISQNPERFYLSGRQTWGDLTTLAGNIKDGQHPLFKEDCKIDIFAYSIGAFLSQVTLMANEKNLFSDSKLFMFCGGSIFHSMYGISRSIMDRLAFNKLQDYYVHHFGSEKENRWQRDNAFYAFFRMILPSRQKTERENFFSQIRSRIAGIALEKDTVIPYHGVCEALGTETTKSAITLLDFPFPYTHENPFPQQTKDQVSLNNAFNQIFSRAVEFFAY
jgi:hypothetical protein